MNGQIAVEDIQQNPYFWHLYFKWFRGFDDKNEINLDEALEVIDVDQTELQKWENDFYESIADDSVKFITAKLNNEFSLRIEFQESEIAFFCNEIYFGNLGGHFEAWFLTWKELLVFEKYPPLFLLLLPMVGVELQEIESAKELVKTHLKGIPFFERDAEYISYCIVNGLLINGYFTKSEIGWINGQNHSVRNIEKYPRYKDDVKELNTVLNKFVA